MCKVILIGMPSSGKSTVGKLLSAIGGAPFTDGDDLIRAAAHRLLHAIIEEQGTEAFLALEERVLCDFLPAGEFVLATGGSAVYSARAMSHLRQLGTIVYLSLPPAQIAARIPDYTARGVVMRGEIHTLQELYAERAPLYERYADLTIDVAGLQPIEIAHRIHGGCKKT